MFLQAGSEYALRALRDLALRGDRSLVPLYKIAESCQVSENYLYKIFQKLSKKGILEAAPGPKKGFRLARKPEAISLLEVIETVQGPLSAYFCVDNPDFCVRSHNCRVRNVFEEAATAVQAVFQKYSLRDVLDEDQGSVRPRL